MSLKWRSLKKKNSRIFFNEWIKIVRVFLLRDWQSYWLHSHRHGTQNNHNGRVRSRSNKNTVFFSCCSQLSYKTQSHGLFTTLLLSTCPISLQFITSSCGRWRETRFVFLFFFSSLSLSVHVSFLNKKYD